MIALEEIIFSLGMLLCKSVFKVLERQGMTGICAVDLFCGAGGLTHGFEQAGLTVKVGYDIDPICEFPYKTNNKAKFILQSVEDIRVFESDIIP